MGERTDALRAERARHLAESGAIPTVPEPTPTFIDPYVPPSQQGAAQQHPGQQNSGQSAQGQQQASQPAQAAPRRQPAPAAIPIRPAQPESPHPQSPASQQQPVQPPSAGQPQAKPRPPAQPPQTGQQARLQAQTQSQSPRAQAQPQAQPRPAQRPSPQPAQAQPPRAQAHPQPQSRPSQPQAQPRPPQPQPNAPQHQQPAQPPRLQASDDQPQIGQPVPAARIARQGEGTGAAPQQPQTGQQASVDDAESFATRLPSNRLNKGKQPRHARQGANRHETNVQRRLEETAGDPQGVNPRHARADVDGARPRTGPLRVVPPPRTDTTASARVHSGALPIVRETPEPADEQQAAPEEAEAQQAPKKDQAPQKDQASEKAEDSKKDQEPKPEQAATSAPANKAKSAQKPAADAKPTDKATDKSAAKQADKQTDEPSPDAEPAKKPAATMKVTPAVKKPTAKEEPATSDAAAAQSDDEAAAHGEPEVNQPVVICDDVHIDFKTLATGQRLKSGQTAGLLQRGRSFKTVNALKGISFVARANESIGIIGSNGSGKSTLMRALTGLIPPTQGAIYAKSRPNLLGVGAALIPDLSGGQNIILGGLAMGMAREEIEAKYDDVVDFSGLGEFIEMPMRTYSSGMTARLKFAIATAKKYEILIVDEALSVGDRAFRKRSEARIRGIRESAGTVFLVSHSMRSIRDTCNRTIWIEKGDLRADGPTDDVLKEYEKRK